MLAILVAYLGRISYQSSSLFYPYHMETSQLICSANQWTGFWFRQTAKLRGKKFCLRSDITLELRKRKLNEPTCPIWYDLYNLKNAKKQP